MRCKWVIVGTVAVLAIALMAAVLPRFSDEQRTLASLRKVDDHPLYVMRYHGDYDLEMRLQGSPSPSSRELSAWQGVNHAWACTCFAVLGEPGDKLLGRNFDWYDHPALLLFTDPPDGYASVSMVDISYLGFSGQAMPATERERLLEAPFWPFDGMNERGLGVGMMAVPRAKAARDADKVSLEGLLVMRVLLDRAQDVEEAIALLPQYNVYFHGPPLHYLLADASGHSAVVEFVDGYMRVLRNGQPWQVSTNFVISEAQPQGADSECWRYNRVHEVLKGVGGGLSDEEAMDLLKTVSQGNTIWSLVYNLSSGEVRVAMAREYDEAHLFRLDK